MTTSGADAGTTVGPTDRTAADAQVRPATADDAAALARVQVTSCPAAYLATVPPARGEKLTVEARADRWRLWSTSHPDDVLLVRDTALAGTVGFVLARCEPWHEMDAYVQAIHVVPEHRLQGHGRALLHAAATELWARGCGPIGLTTREDDPVRDWYDLIGGVPVADEVDDIGGSAVREVVYRWDLAAELACRLAA